MKDSNKDYPTLKFRLSEELKKQLERDAKVSGKTVSEHIRYIINTFYSQL